ncbi:hypothetical protein BDR26DRAFT_867326 [Obelidium mucronatum]|nr:hypothetical protein BDR26DRAFT_867326 [Obelidium mucronatum]
MRASNVPPELEPEASSSWFPSSVTAYLPSVSAVSAYLSPTTQSSADSHSSENSYFPSASSLYPNLGSSAADNATTAKPGLRRQISTYLFTASDATVLPTTHQSISSANADSNSGSLADVSKAIGGLRRSVSSWAISGKNATLKLAGYSVPEKRDIVIEEEEPYAYGAAVDYQQTQYQNQSGYASYPTENQYHDSFGNHHQYHQQQHQEQQYQQEFYSANQGYSQDQYSTPQLQYFPSPPQHHVQQSLQDASQQQDQYYQEQHGEEFYQQGYAQEQQHYYSQENQYAQHEFHQYNQEVLVAPQ